MVVAVGITSEEVRSLAGKPAVRRSERVPGLLKCLVVSVLQDQFNRRTEVLQTLFPGFALAIGFGHFRAECNEPFFIALNDCRVAISHDRTLAGAIPLRNLAVRRWGVANTVVDSCPRDRFLR